MTSVMVKSLWSREDKKSFVCPYLCSFLHLFVCSPNCYVFVHQINRLSLFLCIWLSVILSIFLFIYSFIGSSLVSLFYLFIMHTVPYLVLVTKQPGRYFYTVWLSQTSFVKSNFQAFGFMTVCSFKSEYPYFSRLPREECSIPPYACVSVCSSIQKNSVCMPAHVVWGISDQVVCTQTRCERKFAVPTLFN